MNYTQLTCDELHSHWCKPRIFQYRLSCNFPTGLEIQDLAQEFFRGGGFRVSPTLALISP